MTGLTNPIWSSALLVKTPLGMVTASESRICEVMKLSYHADRSSNRVDLCVMMMKCTSAYYWTLREEMPLDTLNY